jgi:deglycase
MSRELDGMKIAILVEDGFEQVEMTGPRKALEDAGATTFLISPREKSVRGWQFTEWGDEFPVDLPLAEARPGDFDALHLPGGVMNPDKLRMNERAVRFIRAFFDDQKPVSVICHGPWPLIDAEVTRGRTLTSWPSLRSDLKNAGAHWVDQEVVVDWNLITSRKPDDLPAFNRTIVAELSKPLTGQAPGGARASGSSGEGGI